MLFHKLFYFGKLGAGKSKIGGQRDGAKPKLGFQIVTSHMDVRRLISFAAVKMKPIRADAHHCWHGSK